MADDVSDEPPRPKRARDEGSEGAAQPTPKSRGEQPAFETRRARRPEGAPYLLTCRGMALHCQGNRQAARSNLGTEPPEKRLNARKRPPRPTARVATREKKRLATAALDPKHIARAISRKRNATRANSAARPELPPAAGGAREPDTTDDGDDGIRPLKPENLRAAYDGKGPARRTPVRVGTVGTRDAGRRARAVAKLPRPGPRELALSSIAAPPPPRSRRRRELSRTRA